MSDISEDLLSKAVIRINSVVLGCTCLTGDQVTALCGEIVKNSQLKLQSLDISCIDVFKVPDEILAKAVCKLQYIEMSYTEITNEQAAVLFREMIQAGETLSLETLKIESIGWATAIDNILFANALCNLVNVDFNYGFLTNDEIECVCETVANFPKLKIQYLNVEGMNLSGVSPGVLMNAFKRIPITRISAEKLNSNQLDELIDILENVGETKLQKLVVILPVGASRFDWRSRFKKVEAKVKLEEFKFKL